MFSPPKDTPLNSGSDHDRLLEEETQSFLPGHEQNDDNQPGRKLGHFALHGAAPWKCTTAILTLLLAICTFLQLRSGKQFNYETGFDTDLEPALSAIQMRKVKFLGNIIVNETGGFEVELDVEGPRYVGHPTRELDAAWDRLVGRYLALTKSEADRVHGQVSEDGGRYFVVPHVRHSLHCVNYLRKVAYDRWYPTIRTENKPTVPDFGQHVDHCVEILRQSLQCQSDLTPVPHIWSDRKMMYLADTSLEHTCRDYDAIMEWQDHREESWESGKLKISQP